MKREALAAVATALLVTALTACTPGDHRDHAPGSRMPEAQPNSSVETTALDAYAAIPKDRVQPGISLVEFVWDARDPLYGFRTAPVVARIRVDTIAGGRTFSPVAEQAVYPQTVGRFTVLEVFKGPVKAGSQLNYSRSGGIVSYGEYWKSLNAEQQEKMTRLNGGHKPVGADYVQAKSSGDIDVHVGKEYLAFLTPQTSKDGRLREYAIVGFQHGLRDIKGDGRDAAVLNNDTAVWEPLATVVPLR
ncbi:hypothetical protein QFZ52_001658 [Arthrobacter woluwensis]|uniref:hypothetical protein n=1 Tax=Arthrobacter woluwensis TaxID=156980 RepID=UPI002780A66B|nr:hypothetical protein [Arthrobacter woluwensis]MDQ0709006.1 hypothetical protein [Arthrobacter woluwensis]